MLDTIQVGLIGTGRAAAIYARLLSTLKNARLISVAGSTRQKADDFIRKNQLQAQGYVANRLVELNDVDAVIIAVPPFAQPEIAMQAFRNKKHVLCEKPLAIKDVDADAVVQAWKQAGTVGKINFCYRSIPAIAAFRRLITQPDFGELQHVHVEWLLSNRLNKELTWHWKGQKELGGGVIYNFGIHVLDYLFADIDDVQITGANTRMLYETRPDEQGVEKPVSGEEEAWVEAVYGENKRVTIRLSLVEPEPSGHSIMATSERGTLRVSNPDPSSPAGPFQLFNDVDGLDPGTIRDEKNSVDGLDHLFQKTLTAFFTAIRNGHSTSSDIESGRHALRIANLIHHQAKLKTV